MPVIDDLQLPIKKTKISGPGVDSLEKRKEFNNNNQEKTVDLRGSFNGVKDSLLSGFKALANTPLNTKK
jgi:hypothetical protein